MTIQRSLLALAAAACLCASSAPLIHAQEQPATSQPAKKELTDFRKLKELLPETVAGLKRSNAEGSKQGMGEMKFSQAVGTYSEEGKEQRATVTIMDYGAMPGMLEGMAAWVNMEIDNESDTQTTKTTTINGHKAYEEYDKANKSGHIIIVVGKRYWVEVRAESGIDAAGLKKAAEGLKLKELAALDK